MSSELKAIETPFRGYRMRSRAEARWAVVFQTLGTPWLYKPEGYDLDGVPYLPDFFLPKVGVFFEVKGPDDWRSVEPLAVTKAKLLARQSGHRVVVMAGEIPYPHPGTADFRENAVVFFPKGDEDTPYWLCECWMCGQLGVEFEGRSDRLLCGCAQLAGITKARGYSTPRLIAAYEAARSARF